MKKSIAHLMVLALLIMGCQKKQNDVLEVFVTPAGAINGYDPVAYYKESQPVKGNQDYSYQWNDATWFFSNEENLSLFKTAPEKYAPQYGGYCAYGMAEGHKATTEPDAWTIVNDKLYLNYNKDLRTEWQRNQEEFIKQADDNWPTVKDDPF